MGLFSKKTNDDEEDVAVPLQNRAKPPPPPPPSEASSGIPVKAAGPPTKPDPVKHADPPKAPPLSSFGIEEAVLLVRQLPTRNTELVMQVVKKTLESVRVDVASIIDGATKKEHTIEDRISTLKKDIERLEGQIATAKKEIFQLEAEQKEVTGVKERLIQAQKEADVSSDRPLGGPPSVKPTITNAPVPPQAPPAARTIVESTAARSVEPPSMPPPTATPPKP